MMAPEDLSKYHDEGPAYSKAGPFIFDKSTDFL